MGNLNPYDLGDQKRIAGIIEKHRSGQVIYRGETVGMLIKNIEKLTNYIDRLLSDESRVWMCTGCGFMFVGKSGNKEVVSLEDTSIGCPQCGDGRARPQAFILNEENDRLRGQVKELIGWGNLLADEYDPNNKHNHSSICPKGVLGSHQALEGECNCDYEKKYQKWHELVKRVESGEVK
jgi:hypothetical protein